MRHHVLRLAVASYCPHAVRAPKALGTSTSWVSQNTNVLSTSLPHDVRSGAFDRAASGGCRAERTEGSTVPPARALPMGSRSEGNGTARGQSYTFPEEDLIDWMVARPDGSEEGNVVGVFLDSYRPPVCKGV